MDFNLRNLEIIKISRSFIDETEEFCRIRGKESYEAKVYWLGEMISSNKAKVTRIYIPKQIPRKSMWGVSVEVPEDGNLELIENLKNNEFALAKLHTHPKKAYLSEVDLCNPFFRHEGAISVVIPEFCRNPLLNLTHCDVNIFKNGKWRNLTVDTIKKLFIIEE